MGKAHRTKVPPFIDEEAERLIQQTRQSAASYIIMAFGWALLTVAMVGGVYLVFRYLTAKEGETFSMLAPLVILGIAYLAGWIVSLVSIRVFYNLIMSMVVKVYSFGVLAAMLLVYGRAINKILRFQVDNPEFTLPSGKYFLVLFAGYFLLVSLSLLVSDLKLTPHAILLLIGISAHIIVAVYHHVFAAPVPPELVVYDVYFLGTIVIIVILLFQTWLYKPLKIAIARSFHPARR